MTAPINPNNYMTLTEVAYELGISRQRVKQIETAALKKLRNNKKMRAYYEGIIDGRMVNNSNRVLDINSGYGRRW
jgi:predicted transcriptional regulator